MQRNIHRIGFQRVYPLPPLLCSTVQQRGGNDGLRLLSSLRLGAAHAVVRAGRAGNGRARPARDSHLPLLPLFDRRGRARVRHRRRRRRRVAYSAEAPLREWERGTFSLKPAFRHEARASPARQARRELFHQRRSLCCITIGDHGEDTMVQSEEEVLKAAQAILEQKQYQKLRNYIYVSVACTLSPPSLSLDPHGATFRGRKGGRKRCKRKQARCTLCRQTSLFLSDSAPPAKLGRRLQYCALAPIPPLPTSLPLSPKK